MLHVRSVRAECAEEKQTRETATRKRHGSNFGLQDYKDLVKIPYWRLQEIIIYNFLYK